MSVNPEMPRVSREMLLSQVANGLCALFEKRRLESFKKGTFWDEMMPATDGKNAFVKLPNEQGGIDG